MILLTQIYIYRQMSIFVKAISFFYTRLKLDSGFFLDE